MENRQRDEFITQVLSTIEEADVLTIFFPNLAKALVVDVRTHFEEGPMIEVANQLGSMEERMANIERIRPGLGRVRSIAGIPWTKSVRTLEENNVISHLEARLVAAGMDRIDAAKACYEAYNKLKQLEYVQWVDLIKGHGLLYKTVWQTSENFS